MTGVVAASKILSKAVANRKYGNLEKIDEVVIAAKEGPLPTRFSPSVASWAWENNRRNRLAPRLRVWQRPGRRRMKFPGPVAAWGKGGELCAPSPFN